jgi:hypothetical protein
VLRTLALTKVFDSHLEIIKLGAVPLEIVTLGLEHVGGFKKQEFSSIETLRNYLLSFCKIQQES